MLSFGPIKVVWFIFGLIVSMCLSGYPPLQAEGESSALRDGSLVDLCGATLLWRTGEGLMRAPTLRHLEALRQELNASRPQCPVGLSTLAFPSLPRSHRWEPQSVSKLSGCSSCFISSSLPIKNIHRPLCLVV